MRAVGWCQDRPHPTHGDEEHTTGLLDRMDDDPTDRPGPLHSPARCSRKHDHQEADRGENNNGTRHA